MPTNQLPHILVFFSDQHNANITQSAGDPLINTPNLATLTADGTEFTNAYTSCPLSVPARASFLTGQLPSHTGIFTNNGIINSEQATFVHSLAAAGYETVLCGRMHFLGPDQYHGFTKRLVGDFTPCYHGRYGQVRSDLGPYVLTPAREFDRLYGGGTSPVLEYDLAVINAALDYLAQPHDRPQFIVVGTYGPHHTFVAPPDLYQKYLDIVTPPDSTSQPSFDLHPAMQSSVKTLSPDVVKPLRAAYYGLIEHIDIQLGRVREAWQSFLNTTNHPGLFCYMSDHGEQAGEKGLWGKMSFYENSARIPLILAGQNIPVNLKINSPCSIMDLGPTLCDLTSATAPPEQDGQSLLPTLNNPQAQTDRYVLSEMLPQNNPARMVRQSNFKYIAFAHHPDDDQLFDLSDDPHEYHNVINQHPDIARQLRTILNENWNPQAIIDDNNRRMPHWKLLGKWGSTVDVEEPYRWKIPQSAWKLPTP